MWSKCQSSKDGHVTGILYIHTAFWRNRIWRVVDVFKLDWTYWRQYSYLRWRMSHLWLGGVTYHVHKSGRKTSIIIIIIITILLLWKSILYAGYNKRKNLIFLWNYSFVLEWISELELPKVKLFEIIPTKPEKVLRAIILLSLLFM